ncbi:MAG: ATPase domain-containing protein [Euryarchaeota archaeon]|nr:ATPase domain-containing protein [Euryarchaeota archaeon]
MADIERIPTGIPGLDEMMNGGLPFPSTVLLAGGTGTGKTTFCMQFLFKGAKIGERGLYFTTFSEPPEWMLKFLSSYDFVDPKRFGQEIRYVDLSYTLEKAKGMEEVLEAIESEIVTFKPKRIVIDPISVMEDLLKDDYRRFLFRFATMTKNWQTATLVTGEAKPGSPYPLELAYIADGVIIIYNTEVGRLRRRSLEILKMRGTSHMTGKQAVDISKRGFLIHPGL